MNRDLRGERGVVESDDIPHEAGAVFWYRGEGSTPGVTAKTSRLLSAGASEKQVENSEGGPGQARARAAGEAVLGKYREFRRARSECRIAGRRRGLPTRPRLCEWRRGR